MRDPNCRRCSLWQSSKHVCVWGDGPTNADIVLIGEAPGEAEARTGKPFMGRSGQLLREELDKAGIKNHYITNIVKCRPPDNRTPTREEIKACRPFLDEELATVRPKFVATLGAPASKSVLKRAKITESHGEIVEMPNFRGIPIYHPAYVLRDPSKLPAFQYDLGRLARASLGISENQDVEWHVVGSETLDEFVERFAACSEFSFDLETTGLFPYDRKGLIRCCGFAFDDAAWVVPLSMPNSPFRSIEAQLAIFELLFDLAKGKCAIAHNGKFDNQWLQIYLRGKFYLNFDTMLAHHILDENSPHGLKGLVRGMLDFPDYDLSLKEKQGDISPMKLYEYNALDCIGTLRLKQIFDRQFRKDRILRRLFYKLVMPAARAFEDIELEGMVLDVPRMNQVQTETEAEVVELEARLNEMAGHSINWDSPQQVAKVLFGDFKLRPRELTKGGSPSTAEATLLQLRHEHPIAELLTQYREAQKFLSTYLVGLREFMVDDRLYLGYKLHGTVTGRYSSRLHSVPRDGTIRNLWIAPEGWEFVQLDLSQAELRIAAILSKDPELLTCYRTGVDVHWKTLLYTIQAGGSGDYIKPAIDTAKKLTGKILPLPEALREMLKAGPDACIKIWSGWKEARKKAKGINFGFLYSMREPKFIEYAELKYGFTPTYQEAKRYRQAFFHLYPGLEPWHDKQRKLVNLDGFVRTLTGRMRRLPAVNSSDKMLRREAERQAINSPVQGFIGEYKAMALIEMHERLPRDEVKIIGEHHDAILSIFRKDRLMENLETAIRIAELPRLLVEFGLQFPIQMEVEATVGPWGAGEKIVL